MKKIVKIVTFRGNSGNSGGDGVLNSNHRGTGWGKTAGDLGERVPCVPRGIPNQAHIKSRANLNFWQKNYTIFKAKFAFICKEKITHFSNRLIFVRVYNTIASPKVLLTKSCCGVFFVNQDLRFRFCTSLEMARGIPSFLFPRSRAFFHSLIPRGIDFR